ncbi:MAG: hypothetical protein KGV50_04720 [Gammaproteobacteria bacterium]|nr:hypothetical protein [Gammaproteobacteria bacterium]
MNTIKKKSSFALAATAALLLAGCASDEKNMPMKDGMDKSSDMGQCHGVNSCKGTSACATAESSCMGHNSCKGKGWVKSTAKACNDAGGKFMK